ncbi:hypothetical protein ACIKP7_01350 [Pseudomonas caricapapayae]|uniref:Uncharacterized protein n=1 Tax=Pseudomonas caricapapayae TaxID=46678 RepID=A0ACC7LNX9_9PSED
MCGGGGGILGTIKKLDPLRGGDVILDKFGLPSLMGDKNGILSQTADATSDTVGSSTTEEKSVSTDVQDARDSEKRRRAAAAGMSSTILGGSAGTGTTASKTLLGQ